MAGEGREMKQREFVLCTRKKEEKSAPVVTGPQTCRICSGVTIIFAPPPPANIRYGPWSTFEPLMPVQIDSRLHRKKCVKIVKYRYTVK